MLGDYHGQGGGLYLRRLTPTGYRTRRLTGDPNAPVAISGGDSAVYLDGARLMHWNAGANAPHPIAAPLTPGWVGCSETGQIAAMARDGTLMLGDASAKLRAIAGPRYADVAWSPAGQLAACTRDEPGLITLLDPNSRSETARWHSREQADAGSGAASAPAAPPPARAGGPGGRPPGPRARAAAASERSLAARAAGAAGGASVRPEALLELLAVFYPGAVRP